MDAGERVERMSVSENKRPHYEFLCPWIRLVAGTAVRAMLIVSACLSVFHPRTIYGWRRVRSEILIFGANASNNHKRNVNFNDIAAKGPMLQVLSVRQDFAHSENSVGLRAQKKAIIKVCVLLPKSVRAQFDGDPGRRRTVQMNRNRQSNQRSTIINVQ